MQETATTRSTLAMATTPQIFWVAITIHAGAGQDELVIDDSDAEAGLIALTVPPYIVRGEHNYSFDSTTFTKTSSVAGSVTSLLDFDGVTSVLLDSAGSNELETLDRPFSTVEIIGVASGTEVTVNGNGGKDHFVIGGGDFDTNIRGDVRINGGTGEKTLLIDDQADGGADDYTFSAEGIVAQVGTFTKNSDGLKVSTLRFKDLDSVELDANDSDNLIDVERMLSTTDLSLNGNDGIDQFHVSVVGQVSDVQISGGRPFSSPGDSLYVTGNGLLDATYTPHLNDPSAGTIVISSTLSSGSVRNKISFKGLEPVNIDAFDTVTMVTPRSHDIISVSNQGDGWSMIGGISGHPALPLPLESLSFRDVSNVVLDTATNDLSSFSYPPGPSPTTYPPAPNDTVNILPGALDARGLESFDVVTGYGFNIVDDSSLDAGIWQPAELNVDGSGGRTDVNVYGDLERVDAEQFSGRRAGVIGFDGSGNPIKVVGVDRVELLVFPSPIDSMTAIGRDVNRVFSGTTDQTISGPDLTSLRFTPQTTDSELIVVAQGDSVVELRGIPFVIDEISAGPQPEPPLGPDNLTVQVSEELAATIASLNVTGYGLEDTVTVNGFVSTDGVTSLPTTFNMLRGPYVLIELLVFGDPLKGLTFQLESDALGGVPLVGVFGNPTVNNYFTAFHPDANDPLIRTPPLVHLSGSYVSATIVGSAGDERLSVGTLPGGGTRIDMVNPLDAGRGTHILADSLGSVESDGGGGFDEFSGEYRDPSASGFLANLEEYESIATFPAGDILPGQFTGAIRQTLTPSAGEFVYGNTRITHDDAVGVLKSDGVHKIELLVAGDPRANTITRPMAFALGLGGSEAKVTVENLTFTAPTEFKVTHKDGAANFTTIQESNVIYQGTSQLEIVGGEGGTNDVLIARTGVKYATAAEIQIKAKSGNTLAVITETDVSTDDSSANSIDVTSKGDVIVKMHKDRQTTSKAQIDELQDLDPENAPQIQTLKSKADQSLLEDTADPQPVESESKFEFTGDSAQAKIDLVNKVTESKLTAKIQNPGGTTEVSKLGFVVTEIPALVGTGIDPTTPIVEFQVTTTSDDGTGSLRQAINAANAYTGDGLAVITYAIPETDPGYTDVDSQLTGGDSEPDVFVISPDTPLPAITRGDIVINGQSQQTKTGDTNPFGPEIVLAGHGAGANADGLALASAGNMVHGMNIQRFDGSGILVTADSNTLTGNYIGLNAPNGTGVLVIGAADNVFRSNVISGNLGTGVVIRGNNAIGNRLQRNSIYDNGGLGIDLGGDGVTSNDEKDADVGPNDLQNFPVLRNVKAGSETKLVGQLKSVPGRTFVIDFYAGASADATGYGEGARWLGAATVTANKGGIASFNVTIPSATVGGESITATATDSLGNTSEFSAAVLATAKKQGKDLLIGGTLANDSIEVSHGDTSPALAAEGSSGDDRLSIGKLNMLPSWLFADRVNGNTFVTTDGDSPSIIDDSEQDRLHGLAGRDSYFANLEDDQLSNLRSDDILSRLGSSLAGKDSRTATNR